MLGRKHELILTRKKETTVSSKKVFVQISLSLGNGSLTGKLSHSFCCLIYFQIITYLKPKSGDVVGVS